MKVAKNRGEGRGFEILTLPDSTIPDTYISFAIPGQFLGAVVIANPNFGEAVARCIELGLYPGGSALCFSVPPGAYPRETLLTRESLSDRVTLLKDMAPKDAAVVLANSTEFCGGCLKQGVN